MGTTEGKGRPFPPQQQQQQNIKFMDGLVTMMMPGIVKSLSLAPGIAKAHLSMKQGSLFCFVLFVRLRSLKP
jgi:hypothetical protein